MSLAPSPPFWPCCCDHGRCAVTNGIVSSERSLPVSRELTGRVAAGRNARDASPIGNEITPFGQGLGMSEHGAGKPRARGLAAHQKSSSRLRKSSTRRIASLFG